MKYLFIASIILVVWIVFEIWRAPEVDHNNNIVKPAKKIKDLFK